MEMHSPIEFLTCLVWLWTVLAVPKVTAVRKEQVCSSMDLRNSVTELNKLENCTVIEGNLQILLIDHADWSQYKEYSFPDLVEITDYLLLYRAFGLKTLRLLFPNLSVIRGQELFFNYALVIFEMYDFEEIGLSSLTSIERGAVRLEKNPKLCYIETINWSYITNVKKEDHFIFENKNIDECVDVCPRDEKGRSTCPTMDIKMPIVAETIIKQPLCWDAEHCQKVCSDTECHDRGCYQTTNDYGENREKCCHSQCVGGCTGPEDTDCIACKGVSYDNRCLEKCPTGTAKFYNRRCITHTECYSLLDYTHNRENRLYWKVLDTGECTRECPVGYKEVKDEPHKCEECKGPCPRECPGAVVDNVQAAQKLKSCTVVNGILEVQIGGGSHVGQELEESLGLIEKVTHYVKIARSYAIMSLSFLKSLRVIQGERRYIDRYALIVVDNDNLEDIWDFDTHPNLTIYEGVMFFHHNRKLCMSKINHLIKRLGLEGAMDEKDISPLTNGNQGACDVTRIKVEAMSVTQFFAIVRWTNYLTADNRELLGWVVHYREAPERNVTIYDARNACGLDVWRTMDVKPDTTHNATHIAALVLELEPFKQYALFVRSYTISTATHAAMSNILYITTSPSVPTPPRDLVVEATEPDRLLVRWKPPSRPNGNVTHYYVFYQPQALDAERFDQRDYCEDKLRHSQYTRIVTIEQGLNNSKGDNLTGCCSCPEKGDDQELDDEVNRIFQIQFQDFLQNSLYQKRPTSSPDPPTGYTRPREKRSARKKDDGLPQSNHNARDIMKEMSKNNNSLLNEMGNFSMTIPNMTREDLEEEEPYKLLVVYNATEIILPNLNHFQEYNIEVIACHDMPEEGDKLCSNRAITNARTLADVTADTIAPENISTSYKSGDSGQTIAIYWPDPPAPNGVVITYEIELSLVGIADYKPDIYCIQHMQYEEIGGYVTNSLKHGNYSFRIRATSLSGNGSWTPFQYFFIPSMEEASTFNFELVIGAAVGGIFLLIVVVVVSVWWVAKKRFERRIPTDVLFASVNPEYWNASDLYVADEWEVPRDKITTGIELGQGSFGMVYAGVARGLKDCSNVIKVAVKTVNVNASIRDRIEFLNEASVMKAFNCNHVVKLLGVVSKGQPSLVVMELMGNGDLKSYLRSHRPDYSESCDKKPPTLKEIKQMAGEIADGMAYLSAEKFVHRDLAARNCMVAEDMTVKIGDFGMTRDIYETDYYRKGGKGLLPVRWMAPESLKDGVFTSLSDVWSFGVVLWEMATLAAQPYQGLANEQVLKYVVDGGIMERPEGCPDQLYELMCLAWHHNPADRPTFCEIIEILIPDLNPSFKEVSYFFSRDVHLSQAHNLSSEVDDFNGADDSRTPLTRSPKRSHGSHLSSLDPLDDSELDMDMEMDEVDIESQSELSYDSRHSSRSRNSHRSRNSAVCYHDDPQLATSCNCNCKPQPGKSPIVGLNNVQWRRPSANSVNCPPEAESAINSNEGSKGSSKSSGSGTNGHVANGRVKMLAPMNC